MGVTAHIFPSFTLAMGQGKLNLPADTLQVLLASGTYSWNSAAVAAVHVSDFLAGSGSGALTEVSASGTGYSRLTLATVALTGTIAAPAGYTTLTVSANPSWTATFTCNYALFFDNASGSDTSNQVIAYWDLGGTQVATAANPFTLELGTSNGVAQALAQWVSG